MNPAAWKVLETKDAMRVLYTASKRPGASKRELSEIISPQDYYNGMFMDLTDALDALKGAGLVQVLRSDRTDTDHVYPTVKGCRVAKCMESAVIAMEVRCRKGVQRPNGLYVPTVWGCPP